MSKLMERKPHKRLGMLMGRAADIKRHKWFAVRSFAEGQKTCITAHSFRASIQTYLFDNY